MLKIGIIGCGTIARIRHIPETVAYPNCELIGFCGARPGSAERMAEVFGGRAFASVDEMLASDVDAVCICTANFDHAEHALRALRAGKHVLCEKPMAMNIQDCEAMVKAATEAGKRLMIAQNQRFYKAHQRTREILRSGMLGKILTFHTVYGHAGPEGWTGNADPWFFHKEKAVLGVMADLGIHKTDIIRYLLDEDIVEVTAKLDTLAKTYPDGSRIDVDDNAFCIYTMESGIIGSMHVSWTFQGAENNATRFYGTNGTLRIYDDPDYSVIVEMKDGTVIREAPDRVYNCDEVTSGAIKDSGMISSFADAILTGTESPIEGSDAIKSMRAVLAAAQSAKEGRTVKIGK